MTERGSALLETIAVGFVTLLLVGQALVTVSRIATAGETAEEAARHAATMAANGTSLDVAARVATRLAPGGAVEIADAGDSVTVEIVVQVSVVGPDSGPVTMTVRGVATASRSPYRSGP